MNIAEFLKSCKARSKSFDSTVTIHIVGTREQFIQVGSVYLNHVVGSDKSAVRFGKDKGFIKHKNLLLIPVGDRHKAIGNTCVGTVICAYGNIGSIVEITQDFANVLSLAMRSASVKCSIPMADLTFTEYVGPGPASI
jgi:hypothetical protein